MNDPEIPGISPYPSYKVTMTSRVGQAPEHWDVVPLSAVARVKSVVNKPHLQLLSVYLNEGVILFSEAEERRTNPTSEDLSKYQVVDPGDLVLNNQQAWRGSVGVSRHCGIVSPAYLVLSLNSRLTQRFAELLFRDRMMVDQYLVASKGVGTIQRNLYWPHLKRATTIVPPLDEQAAIVRYLDDADQRIRAYVSAKQRLIGLLEEEKQALIQQAVTRGLDPNVRLKPSGVEWLGDVPEHWKIRRGKRLFSPRQELAKPNDIQLSATQAYGVIPQDEYEQKIGRRVVKISLHLEKRQHVEVDDFVISMRSFQGGLERAWATGCIRSSYVVLRPSIDVDVKFFSHLFKSQAYIQALQSTANFIRDGQDLNFNNFCAVDLPFPPTEEQRMMAVALGEATANIDTTTANARRQIEFMEEYRARLIADVVTGKLDVGEAAGRLPDPDGEDSLTEHQSLSNPTINVTL